MPTPAVVQIRNALAAVADAALAHNVLIDRRRGDAVEDSEMPAVVIAIPDAEFEIFDMTGTLICAADFVFEIYEREASGVSIGVQQQLTMAALNAALMADYTLGGRLQNLVPAGTTGDSENVGDIGAAALTMRATWQCPTADLNTIIGQSGLFT